MASPSARESRSLANTFPFNSDGGLEDLPSRDSRQGAGGEALSIPFTEVAKSYAGGKRWVQGRVYSRHFIQVSIESQRVAVLSVILTSERAWRVAYGKTGHCVSIIPYQR